MLTGRSDQFNPHTSVYVLIGCWQGPVTTDRTRPVPFSLTGCLLYSTGRWTLRVRSALTGRVRSQIYSSETLLESTERCLSASGRTRRNLLGQMN